MVDVRSIPGKMAAARTQAKSYWLIVAVCLLVQLFPVLHNSDQLQFEKAKPGKLLFLAHQWTHEHKDPHALVPVRPQARHPVNIVAFVLHSSKPAALRSIRIRPYLATGPPPAV